MHFQEVEGGRGEWMELAQVREAWRVFVSTVREISGSIKCGEFLD
jgi:hypothetical protein